ncbi:MAG: GTP cyclohydrolase MptA [Thermoplasmata archaeon]
MPEDDGLRRENKNLHDDGQAHEQATKEHGADTQGNRPLFPYWLSKAGVSNVRKPLVIKRNGRLVHITAHISAFVDLPSHLKGTHMSRNLEIINDVIDTSVREEITSLEGFCLACCRRLLEQHEYATMAGTVCTGDYFLERLNPSGRKTIENYTIEAEGRIEKGGNAKKSISVTSTGMSACPCAMENVAEILEKEYSISRCNLEGMPLITHNQRNIATLKAELPVAVNIDADHLIDIMDSSFSAPTYEILKRSDEAKVVFQAHSSPKFVEDIVRAMLEKFVKRYSHLAKEHPGILITARSIAEESIHKHNAFAERTATLGELVEEIAKN